MWIISPVLRTRLFYRYFHNMHRRYVRKMKILFDLVIKAFKSVNGLTRASETLVPSLPSSFPLSRLQFCCRLHRSLFVLEISANACISLNVSQALWYYVVSFKAAQFNYCIMQMFHCKRNVNEIPNRVQKILLAAYICEYEYVVGYKLLVESI
jgi:hypothetical protein